MFPYPLCVAKPDCYERKQKAGKLPPGRGDMFVIIFYFYFLLRGHLAYRGNDNLYAADDNEYLQSAYVCGSVYRTRLKKAHHFFLFLSMSAIFKISPSCLVGYRG